MLMVDGELHTKMRRFPMVIRGNIRMVRTWQLDDYSSKNTLIRCHRCHLQHLITESAQGDALQRYHFKHVFHITATFVLLFQTLPSKPTFDTSGECLIVGGAATDGCLWRKMGEVTQWRWWVLAQFASQATPPIPAIVPSWFCSVPTPLGVTGLPLATWQKWR